MKKLFLILLIAPILGFGQSQYRLEIHTDTQVENNRKWVSDYDENGNRTNFLWKKFDEDSQSFKDYIKRDYIYDNNLKIEESQFKWENESWVGLTKSEYEHVNGVISQIIESDWENGSWVYEYKYVREYDTNVSDRLLSQQKLKWSNDTWAENLKWESQYDTNGNEILFQYFTYNEDLQSYQLYSKQEKTYNENNEKIEQVNYSHCSTSCHNSSKHEYYYDNGNLINVKYYNWQQNGWVLTSEYEYEYDDNGNQTKNFRLISVNGVLVTKDLILYQFDNYGNRIFSDQTYYDETTNTILFTKISEWEYDQNFLISYLVDMDWLDGDNESYEYKTEYTTQSETETNLVRVGVTSEYDSVSDEWNTLTDEQFNSYYNYVKLSSLSNISSQLNDVTIYPNPTTSVVTLQGGKQYDIEVYTLQGKKVMALTGNTLQVN